MVTKCIDCENPRDSAYARCSACIKVQTKLRQEQNKDRVKICSVCKEIKRVTEFPTQYRRKDGYSSTCQICITKRITAYSRAKATGWTQKEYDTAFEEQEGKCAICKQVPVVKALAADHNHKSLEKRGLLCSDCNLSIAGFNEDIDTLLSAIEYLKKWKGYFF